MTKAELENYRQQLLTLGKRLNSEAATLAAEALRGSGGDGAGNLSKLPIHLADLGSDNYDQELTLSFLENDTQLATEIHDALERIEQGAFGKCEECRQPIPAERL